VEHGHHHVVCSSPRLPEVWQMGSGLPNQWLGSLGNQSLCTRNGRPEVSGSEALDGDDVCPRGAIMHHMERSNCMREGRPLVSGSKW
jgi:hypothetical protein